MDALSQNHTRAEAAMWQAVALFSTLATAADVSHAMQERRAGRDPSAQETDAMVRPYLRRAAGDLQARLMQLQASRLQAERVDEKGYVAALVHRYHELMAVRRVEQKLHVIHQRLLSLYPAVTEALVEDARLLHRQSEALLADEESLSIFLHRALVFCERLLRELVHARGV